MRTAAIALLLLIIGACDDPKRGRGGGGDDDDDDLITEGAPCSQQLYENQVQLCSGTKVLRCSLATSGKQDGGDGDGGSGADYTWQLVEDCLNKGLVCSNGQCVTSGGGGAGGSSADAGVDAGDSGTGAGGCSAADTDGGSIDPTQCDFATLTGQEDDGCFAFNGEFPCFGCNACSFALDGSDPHACANPGRPIRPLLACACSPCYALCATECATTFCALQTPPDSTCYSCLQLRCCPQLDECESEI